MQGNHSVLNGATAQTVVQERHRLGLSQRQTARFADLAPSTVAKLEAGGKIAPESAARLGSALAALDVLTGRPSHADLEDRVETVEFQLAVLELELAQLVASIGDFAVAASRHRIPSIEGDLA